ncbi:hypothetical protein J2X46_002733 [Nocardioides sp. BE266]|uniref:PD-(D/E)XK nuclease-like domain-containing protein n=1 Tax=Nocardioides sp. BE266 TaxID=2817725 RepID=UPI0028589BE1|nr:PD-(D/E)XK nuclease-like domain-containing protein [Nocardioides sp. BE266]MDR7253743.1 hypothetical protein [Nocardioides sp. BE266]
MIEPGLRHDLSNDEYHAITDWFSSSQLKAALPEHYKPGGSQEALDFGTLFHTAVLEPDNLAGYVALDATAIAGNNPKTGKPYDAPHMTAKFKAAVAEASESGSTVVAQADLDRALRMSEALRDHATAAQLLFGPEGTNEESAFAVDDDGVRHKARFDRRIPGAIVDLKSTSAKPGRHSLTRAAIDYGYDVSAAHYLAVADLLGLDAPAFALVFVSKDDKPRVTVAEIDGTLLARGAELRRRAIERLTTPDAPAYEGATGFLTLTAPRWAELETSA